MHIREACHSASLQRLWQRLQAEMVSEAVRRPGSFASQTSRSCFEGTAVAKMLRLTDPM